MEAFRIIFGFFASVGMAILLAVTSLFGLFAAPGCAMFKPNQEPMERHISMLVQEVLRPAVDKAATELSTTSAQLQGQVSAIEPGYEIAGDAGWYQAVKWQATIRLKGVSGNLAGATQAVSPGVAPGIPPATPPAPTLPQPVMSHEPTIPVVREEPTP